MSQPLPGSLIERLAAAKQQDSKAATVQHPATTPLRSSEPQHGWRQTQSDHEEEASTERWLISYADFITLLMVLFIMLYALQLVKVQDVRISEQRSQTAETPSISAPQEASTVKDRQALRQRLQPLVDKGLVRLSEDARGVEIDINARILFNPGDARLLAQARAVLQDIAETLQPLKGHKILVEGHTDSTPIATAKYESNWELSSARAGSVVRYFVEQDIAPARLAAMGRADNVPAALGNHPAALARNRRVTILVQD